ncbi:hypothetical protein ACFJ8K_001318 [Escherichia coli]|uniref:hypothetical protein n=1 Tax=Enterobacter sp. TaxID=42895 RepID=UPI00296E626C|nr:hypothetical protein [Enterobacter sp.]
MDNNEISITGFDKDRSVHFMATWECFSKLVFNLSKQPNEEWIDIFQNKAKKYFNKAIMHNFTFNDKSIIISETDVYIQDLQDYVNDLKNTINIANDFMNNEKELNQQRIDSFNSTLDNLSF